MPVLETELMQVNDSNVVIEMVRRGFCVALERKSIVFDLVQSGELKKISDVVVTYPWAYWSVIPEGKGSGSHTVFNVVTGTSRVLFTARN